MWQCCRHYTGNSRIDGLLALDYYGLNLARFELRKAWRENGDFGVLGQVIGGEAVWDLSVGEKLKILVDGFGEGVLVLVGQEAGKR